MGKLGVLIQHGGREIITMGIRNSFAQSKNADVTFIFVF